MRIYVFKNKCVLNIVSTITITRFSFLEEVKDSSHRTAYIISLKYFVMKKSVEAPGRLVQEKNPQKSATPNSEREKIRKPFGNVSNKIRSTKSNEHDLVDKESPIPGLPDTEAGKYTPSHEPW